MKTYIFCLIFLIFTGPGLGFADPMQGAKNGHWYENITEDISWHGANAAARGRSLATGDDEQDNGIHDALADSPGSDDRDPFFTLNLHWIAAFQEPGTLEPAAMILFGLGLLGLARISRTKS